MSATPVESVKFVPTPKPTAGLDSSVSQGAELAGSVVVFFGIGFLVDLWLDTRPVFMITLTVFAMVGQFVKMYFVYSRAMGHLEEERSRSSRGGDR